MAGSEFTELIDDLLYAERYGVLDGLAPAAAKRAVMLGIVDPLIRELIHEPVHQHKIAQAFAGGFPIPKLGSGEIVLGRAVNRRCVRVPLQYTNGHAITVGGSGCGKTTKSRWLVLQVAPRVRGLWLFDFRKQEFGILRPLLRRAGVELKVIPARCSKLNPLQVPGGVNPADWAPRVADLLVMVFQLPPRATKLLHLSILDLYRRFGVFDGKRSFPILAELRAAIATNSEANAPARQAVLDAIDPVLMSIGAALRYRVGWTTSDLATQRIVFEFGGISEADKNLLLNTLVMPEFTRRVARGISNPQMDLWICCDEAARLVNPAGASAMSDLIGLVRGTGIGLDLSVQSADVAPAILSNTANKFIGRCGSAADYDAIGSAMGLSTEQRRMLALTLVPGTFLGQVGEGEWRHPFLFSVPPINLTQLARKEEDELDAEQHMQAELLDLPTVVADGLVNEYPGPLLSVHSSAPVTCPSDAELCYLRAVADHPGQPSTTYPRLAGIGPRRAQFARARLLQLGYLREHLVQTSSRGRPAIILEPLEAGLNVLNQSVTIKEVNPE